MPQSVHRCFQAEMLAQVGCTKYVELDENAILFIDYFQLHITWDSLLPDMPYNVDQYIFISGEGLGLWFLFPICSRWTLLSNTNHNKLLEK